MSQESEKVLIRLSEYLEAHQDEITDDESMNLVAQRFLEEYHADLEAEPEGIPLNALDYLEMAEGAKTKKKKKEYLEKALALEPDNLDVLCAQAELFAKSSVDLLELLPPLIEKGNALMEQGGYFRDSMGEFWADVETRPYMRLRAFYMDTLIECGMMRKACAEGRELLRLCPNDNMGVRYTLMHLYAHLEDEKAARALHKEYGEYDQALMLLPLAVLYYKRGDFAQSLAYLNRLCKSTRGTKKFISSVVNGSYWQYLEEMSPYGYRLRSMDELVYGYTTFPFLFKPAHSFFIWARKSLKK